MGLRRSIVHNSAVLPAVVPIGLPAFVPIGLPAVLPAVLPIGLPIGLPLGPTARSRDLYRSILGIFGIKRRSTSYISCLNRKGRARCGQL